MPKTPVNDLDVLTVVRTDGGDIPVFYYDSVDSTQEEAKRRIAKPTALPFIIVAEKQLAGRGRRGREWLSEPGVGIWTTIAVERARTVAEQFVYTFTASLAVAEAITAQTGLSVHLKWPNDVMMNGKKCCGILLEVQPAAVLIGIGINVNHTHFPKRIENHATSLLKETGRTWPRAELLDRCIRHLVTLDTLPTQTIVDRWKRQSSFLGSLVIVDIGEEIMEGRAVDVAADGGLVIDTEAGRRTVYAGDVRLRLA